jgi:hypothetical protein
MSFLEHFVRPGSAQMRNETYRNRLVAPTPQSDFNESAKYQTLFADAFGHHEAHNLDTPADLELQFSSVRRVITNDSLSSYFLDKLYRPPKIYLTGNTPVNAVDERTFGFFLQSISEDPRTRSDRAADAEGSNLLSLLIGDVGTGKSLLLCKAIRELKREERAKATDPNNKRVLLPVYYSFEKHMNGDGRRLRDIDDTFYKTLADAISTTVAQTSYVQRRLSHPQSTGSPSETTGAVQFVELVRRLSMSDVRLLLVLDNLDGYHYHYSNYAFFPKYHQAQLASVQRNITGLTSAFADGENFGMLGLAVLFAARRYVYEECMHSRDPVSNVAFSGAVFQLEDVDESTVVSSRLALFETAIAKIESEPRLRVHGEDYRKTLDRIKLWFNLEERALHPIQRMEKADGVLRTLRQLCHQGNRGLVSFLSSLRIDHRESAALIERFFWDKPHTLVLLYIANLHERYSQSQSHFPNMFLVDAVVMKDPDYALAHLPHKHTYWLKYLIQAYVSSRPRGVVSTSDLRRQFVKNGGYEDFLFEFALGSLASSREARCLEPVPSEKDIPQFVSAMPRGAYLVSKWGDYRVPFSFSFTYLQLVVDDPLMSYPSCIASEVYLPEENLRYLFSDKVSYGRMNPVYLEKKMKAVLAFILVLEASLEVEREHRKALFEGLERTSNQIVPDFSAIKKDLHIQYHRITSTLGDPLIMDRMTGFERDIRFKYWGRILTELRAARAHNIPE